MNDKVAIVELRSALGMVVLNYHAQSFQHGNKSHSGQYWQRCPANFCKDIQKVWKATETNAPKTKAESIAVWEAKTGRKYRGTFKGQRLKKS